MHFRISKILRPVCKELLADVTAVSDEWPNVDINAVIYNHIHDGPMRLNNCTVRRVDSNIRTGVGTERIKKKNKNHASRDDTD